MDKKKDEHRFLLISPQTVYDALSRCNLIIDASAAGALSPSKAKLRIDSRQVSTGDIFIAYKGVSSDGHSFLGKAQEQGAALVVVESRDAVEGLSIPWIVVSDAREAWAWVAAEAAGNPQNQMKFVGVTGTNGKTSTTWIVSHLLTKCGVPTLLVGTTGARLNNLTFPTKHTTPDPSDLYPLLALAYENGARACAIEVSSHAIAQKKLAPITFTCGAFTSFSRDHLDFHHSMENYWRTKWSFVTDMVAKAGTVFIAEDVQPADPSPAPTACKLVSYGPLGAYKPIPVQDHALLKTSRESIEGSDISLQHKASSSSGHVRFFGDYGIKNFAAALLCTEQIMEKPCPPEVWGSVPDIPGRLERVKSNADKPTVVVDYAHTPDALKKTLQLLSEFAKGHLICVFGCGGDRDQGKRPLMGRIAEQIATCVYLTSDNPRHEDPKRILQDILEGFHNPEAAIVIENRWEAISKAITNASKDDVICIAGKGHETYQMVGDQKLDFDDRLVAKNILESK